MRTGNIFVNYNAILCHAHKRLAFCFSFSYFCLLSPVNCFGPIKHFTFDVARSKWLKFMAADTEIHGTNCLPATKTDYGPQASGLKETKPHLGRLGAGYTILDFPVSLPGIRDGWQGRQVGMGAWGIMGGSFVIRRWQGRPMSMHVWPKFKTRLETQPRENYEYER